MLLSYMRRRSDKEGASYAVSDKDKARRDRRRFRAIREDMLDNCAIPL